MNTAEIVELSRAVQAAYPQVEITDDWLMLWLNAFDGNGATQVSAGLASWINSEHYPPTIAGIREKMREHATRTAREATMYSSRLDPGEVCISIAEGRAIAAMAYERDCQEHGKEPNWTWWDKAMGGLVGKSAS
jgi:hypothetical protein